VKRPNKYATQEEVKDVQLIILDVLFDDEVCSLVYMRDMTSITSESPYTHLHAQLSSLGPAGHFEEKMGALPQ